jgi:hypothetical protein
MVQMYEKMYIDAMALLKNMGAGYLETDTFRSGVVRISPQ